MPTVTMPKVAYDNLVYELRRLERELEIIKILNNQLYDLSEIERGNKT